MISETDIDLAERECLAARRACSADPTPERLDVVTRMDAEYRRLLRCRERLPAAFPRAEEAIERLRAAAPLNFPSDWPVYLVNERDLPGGVVELAGCEAFTSVHLSAQLEALLRDCGAWRGLGFASVFSAAWWEYHPALDNLVFYHCLDTLLHEAAHQLDFFPWEPWPRSMAVVANERCTHGYEAPPRYDFSTTESKKAQRDCHGLRFARAAFHLEHRTRIRDVCPARSIIRGTPVPESMWPELRAALHEECTAAESAGASIGSVILTPPPASFVEAWNAGVAAAAAGEIQPRERAA